MNTKWKMLTLAAMLSATTTSATAGDNGSGGAFDEDAYFSGSSDYAASLYDDNGTPEVVEDSSSISDSSNEVAAYEEDIYENEVYTNDVEPVAYVGDEASYISPSIGSGVPVHAASHNSGRVIQHRRTPSRSRRTVLSSTKTWMTAEALLWFPQLRSTPPLVTTNTAGILPELDQGATVAFGGEDAFGEDMQAGFRLDFGLMLNEDFGVGGRIWFLGEGEDTYANGGDGVAESIGVPFFDSDLTTGQENSIQIGFTDGGALPDFTGTVSARSTLDVYGAEGYGRLRLLENKGYRSDFIGGFSHFGIDENFAMTVDAVQSDNAGGAGGQGDVYNFSDRIDIENRFYGGQVGFLTEVGSGAWRLSALTKIHLGDMEQTLTNNGSRSWRNVGNTQNGIQTDGGILTAGIADSTVNEFAFAPEANLKLTFKMRPHVSFSVGYSFIMWNDVLTVGDNLNRNINSGALVPDGTGTYDALETPATQGLKTDSFYVHGLDLGAVIKF